MNWTWFSPDLKKSTDEWQRLFAAWRASGLDAIIPNIYNGSQAFFQSERFPVAEAWLEKILPLAKAEGLEVHAWMFSMPCNINEIQEKHPQWYAVNRKGEPSHLKPAYVDYYKFLCSNQPGVAEHVQSLVAELSDIELLDGVHLDYIRLPDVILPVSLQPNYGIVQDREYPEFDYCYCDVCRAKFKEQSGIDPMELEDPSQNLEWRQFRQDSITNLVNKILIPTARKNGKKVTAAVFPNWENVRQEWSKWELDSVLPMLYHKFYKGDLGWLKRETEKGVKSLRPEIPLYSGVFVSDLNPAELIQAVEVSLEAGARGVSLFEAFAMSDAHWKSLRQTVQ